MTDRITDANLKGLCDTINRITGSPAESYSDGKSQVGNYHVSHSYGGVCLHRMSNESGGVSDVLYSGHVPKRDLWNRMHGFVKGFETATRKD